jgi:toxin FitB
MVIVLMLSLEVAEGVARKELQDAAQGSMLRIWLEHVVRPNFSGRVIPVPETVALRCAELHVPNKRPELDALIAATALVHDLTVVTRNVKDFASTGAQVFNPWAD